MSSTPKTTKTKQKVKMPAGRKSKYGSSNDRFFNCLIILLISVFLIVMPFFRGLYFRENYIPSIIYISGVFTLYMLYKLTKKDYKFINSDLDIAVLMLPVVYLISFFFSVNAKDAIDMVLKYIGYFMMYKLAADLGSNEKINKMILDIILTSIFIVAITGILSLSGYLNLSGVAIGNRLFGLYQYTNATATVLGAGFILGLGAISNNHKLVNVVLYQLALVTILLAFIITISRGAYIILAFIVLVYLMIVESNVKINAFISIFISIIPLPFVINGFYKQQSNLLGLYIISIIVSCTMQGLYSRHIRHKVFGVKKLNQLKSNILIVAGLILFLFVLLYKTPIEVKLDGKGDLSYKVTEIEAKKDYTLEFEYKGSKSTEESYGIIINGFGESKATEKIYSEFGTPDSNFKKKSINFSTTENTEYIYITFYNRDDSNNIIYKNVKIIENDKVIKTLNKYKFIPDRIARRFGGFMSGEGADDSRIIFAKDGLKLLKDYFILGAGGGAWQNLYYRYQSYTYNTKEAHNFYIQILTETGIIGGIIIAAIIFLIIKRFYRAAFIEKNQYEIALLLSIFMILGHAVLDFELSLSAPAFLLWAFIGLTFSYRDNEKDINSNYNKYIVYAALMCSCITIYTSSTIYLGMSKGNAASKLMKQGVTGADRLYLQAMKLDKYNSDYKIDYAQLIASRYEKTKDAGDLALVQTLVEDVLKYEPYNYKYTNVIISLLFRTGDMDKAVEIANNSVVYLPMQPEAYMMKVQVNYEIANYFFKKSQHELAIPYLDNILETEEQIKVAEGSAIKPFEIPDKFEKMLKLAKNWKQNAERIIQIKKH